MVAHSCNYYCSGKGIIITYSGCMYVTLGIQHEVLMRHIVICGLSGSIIFSTLPHKRHDFRKQIIDHKTCVLIFSTILSEMFLILRRMRRDIVMNVHKFSSYSCRIFMKLKHSRQIFGPICSMRTDVQTERHDEAILMFFLPCIIV